MEKDTKPAAIDASSHTEIDDNPYLKRKKGLIETTFDDSSRPELKGLISADWVKENKRSYYWTEVKEGITRFLPGFLIGVGLCIVGGAVIGLGIAGAVALLSAGGALAGVGTAIAALPGASLVATALAPIGVGVAHVLGITSIGSGLAAGAAVGAASGLVFGKDLGLHLGVGASVTATANVEQDITLKLDAAAREREKQQSRRQIFSDVVKPLAEKMDKNLDEICSHYSQLREEVASLKQDIHVTKQWQAQQALAAEQRAI